MATNRVATSKVKVEYTDPSGIYPKIAGELEARLPLRNLNWNSQTRPLRSIGSLFVDLVSETASQGSSSLTTRDDATSKSSLQKERRHQIPGLRSTPYLKIYLLRCDDTESYKASSRKLLREWIKSHGSTEKNKSSSNQENHDAFEWLIVHVAPVDGGSPWSPWPNKSSMSVYDKVRSDFNGSSKSFDRVTQVPCAFDEPGDNAAQAVTAGAPRDQFIRDANRAWDDLLAKLKALILASFDSRVHQYEEDIKEKSAQRNIPGWNFNLFFVLKEGLARGFESVGLLDDALMGYDELGVELLSAIRSEEEKIVSGQGTSLFRDHTDELRAFAEDAMRGHDESHDASSSKSIGALIVDGDKKPYRELIMSNDISIYDFRSYLFARQVAILLRIAATSVLSLSVAGGDRLSMDSPALTEICKRAMGFIASNSRTVRQDLRTSLNVDKDNSEAVRATKHDIVENIVASWSFATAQQILARTEDPSLSRELDNLDLGTTKPTRRAQRTAQVGYQSQHAQPSHVPDRSSSFANRPQSISLSQAGDGTAEESSHTKQISTSVKNTPLYRLASQRADLYLLCRRSLSVVGERAKWYTGWRNFSADADVESMDEVNLDDSATSSTKEATGVDNPRNVVIFNSSVVGDVLRSSMASKEDFDEAYEDLSWSAHNLYRFSGDEKGLHATITDIATLHFHLKDYSVAASYLHQLAPFYADQNWTELELAILDMYAKCLKELRKVEEYVRIGLKLLAKSCSPQSSRTAAKVGSTYPMMRTINAAEHVASIFSASKQLKEPCSVRLRNYFFEVEVGQHIEHDNDTDGFALRVSWQHVLPQELQAKVKVRLIGLTEGSVTDIWLTTTEPIKLQSGRISAKVVSRTMIPDRYLVDKLIIEVGKVVFQHDYAPKDGGDRAGSRDSSSYSNIVLQTEPIVVWPSHRNLKVVATANPYVHLDRPKAVLLKISTGHLAVTNANLHIRPGTAGLRMYTAEATTMNDDYPIASRKQPGVLSFGSLPEGTTVDVVVPFQMDTEFKQISLRTELTYTTSSGEYVYGHSHNITVVLPLGVNVQDIFKASELYSKFSVSCATNVPLSVLHYDVESTEHFDAATHVKNNDSVLVFAKQPISMVYRITRRGDVSKVKDLATRLSMRIDYQCLDEEITSAAHACLVESLEASEYTRFEPLLSAHLMTTLQDKLPRHDLELIGLLREIGLAPFSEFRWETSLAALPDDDRAGVMGWLEQWHKTHETIVLPSERSSAPVRCVTIPVDVPPMHILHTAHLRVLSDHTPSLPIKIGEAVPAELTIKHSRAWAQSSVGGGKPLTFFYELDASADSWLIGGRRKATFSAREGEESKFAVLLLPQRSGKLLLPTLEVTLLDSSIEGGAKSADLGHGDESQWNCEVDYLSQGESVLVVQSLRSTTVAMDMEGGQAWLLDAEAVDFRGIRAG